MLAQLTHKSDMKQATEILLGFLSHTQMVDALVSNIHHYIEKVQYVQNLWRIHHMALTARVNTVSNQLWEQ